MKKRILALLLAALMVVSLLPVTALAESDVEYIDETGATQTLASGNYIEFSSTNPWNSEKPYVVTADTIVTGPVFLTGGDVKLILCDGKTLTVNGGIFGDGQTLTVYGQTGQTGALVVNGTNGAESEAGGDGTDAVSANVTVNGGNVTVTGGNGGKGYMEGGGTGGKAIIGAVTVNSGIVTVMGGSGGSGNANSSGSGGMAIDGDLAVNGGTVTVTGGNGGSTSDMPTTGIDGDGGNGVSGNVEVFGGETTIIGGAGGAVSFSHPGKNGKTIGGTLTLADTVSAEYGDNSSSTTPLSAPVDSGDYDAIKAALYAKFLGASAPTYTITNGTAEVDKETNHGYISIDKESAAKDETVTVTVVPNEGYELKSLTVAPTIAGALKGEFSVSADKKVHFSQGNLQATYNSSASAYTWGFAANQYSRIGNAAGNTTIDTQTDGAVVDLFGWSTDAASNNWGIHTKNAATEGFTTGNFKDWGEAVGDGNTWRTLSKDEWKYLFSNHSKCATVNGVQGYVIAPDGFEGTLSSTYTDDAALAANNLVFLPADSMRNGSGVGYLGEGYYWSSTAYGESEAYSVNFDNSSVDPNSYDFRNYGFSVRLVTEVVTEAQITPVEQDGTYQFTMPAANVTVTAEFEEDKPHTHDLSVTKSDGSDATEGTVDEYTTADYYWDGDVLHIIEPGLTVTGIRETEETINVWAEDVTLDGVKINTTSFKVPLNLSGVECTVNLINTNTLKTKHTSAVCGFDILITGNGRLDAIADTDMNNRYGIYAQNSLTVNSGTVNAAAENATGSGHDSIGIYVDGNFILGSGTVTAKAGTAAKNSYGVNAYDIKVASGTLIAQGNDKAVNNEPTGNIKTVTASENYDGSSPVTYVPENIASYRYVKVEAAHALTVTKSGGTATEGSDYEWDGSTLIIKQNGLEVSGTTTMERIVVDSSVSALTLNGVNITGSDGESLIYTEKDLTITLVGENTLTQNYGDPAIYVENCALEITGEGNLTVESGFHGIYGATEYESASWKSSTLTINASGNVMVNTTGTDPINLPAAINMDGDITISGSGNVTATSVVGPAIMSEYFNIIISGSGNVTAQSSSEFATIYAANNMTLNASGTITAENESGAAICCGEGALTIGTNTGKIIARGYYDGECGAIELYDSNEPLVAENLVVLGSAVKDAEETDITASASYASVDGDWGAYSYYVDENLAQVVLIQATVTHNFTYSATGKVLKATCGDDGCEYKTTPLTLTLTAPASADLVYSATAKEIGFADGEEDVWKAATGNDAPAIVYYLEDGTTKTTTENSGAAAEGKAPVNAGTYVAKVTVDTNKTAVLEFTVAKKQLSKLHPNITWFADRGYKGNNSVAMLQFDVPNGKSLLADDCGFIGGVSELATFHSAVMNTFEKASGCPIAATATMTTNAPVNYEFTVSVTLPTEYAGNYEVPDFKITAKVKGIYAKPANGEGYTLDDDLYITIGNGYEVNTASTFDGDVKSTGDQLTEGETYYIRRAGDENYYASPATAFVAEVNNCEYTETVSLTEGTFGMKLGGKDMGWFKFEAVDGGWKIMKTAKPGFLGTILNPYLAMKDGKLTYTDSDNATIWTYKNGAFYTSVKTTKEVKTSYGILGWLFGFGGKTTKKDVTTTYYLSTVTDGQNLSTNTVKAELYTEASGAHEYGNWIDCKDGTHKRVCKNCGEWETEAHRYDPDTHKCVCGAYDPHEADVKISVDVKEKTTKQSVGILGWLFGRYKTVTTYTAAIKTEATGVKVTKVQYQLNGSSKWMTGTSVCSDKPIDSLKVKVTDNKGKTYNYEYPEVAKIETLGDLMALQTNFPDVAANGWTRSGDQSKKMFYAYNSEAEEDALHIATGTYYALSSSKLTQTANGYEFEYDLGGGYTYKLTFNVNGTQITSITMDYPSELALLGGEYAPAAE